MKCQILVSVLAAGLLSISAFAQPTIKAGTFTVDPAHSKVGFEIPHLVISSVEGHFKDFQGTVILKDKFEKSTVKATVEVASIDTGTPKRDEHLRSPDFFDVAKYPKMTFESTKIEGKPDSFKLTGKLTLHGVTKPVTFDAKYLGLVEDGMGNEKAAFSATTTIKRADFGLTWNKAVEAGPVVGESLTINLKIQAGRPVAKK